MARTDTESFYQLYFQAPGVAEAELERDARLSLRKILFAASGDAPRHAGGAASAHIAMVPRDGGFLSVMSNPAALPAWLTEADLDAYARQFARSGFRGGLNWYRNIDRNWELTAPWQGALIHQPSLFIAGSNDSVITGLIGAKRVADMERVLPNLRQKLIIHGAGHWIQQERADEVNAALIAFLKGNAATAPAQ
jgi:pimeloyl-ACP methyl ester carboxylesterase